MKILLDLGENSSHSMSLNYLAESNGIFIMDNHLAAFWTMHKLNFDRKYNLLHIDRHYDLVPFYEQDNYIKKIDWTKEPIEELTSHHMNSDLMRYQYIRWDNYIHLFNKLHPRTIDRAVFITQKEGSFNYNKRKSKEIEIYELFEQEFRDDKKWIFNIDVDYFFTVVGDDRMQMFHDDYITKFGEWLYDESENAEQIIICLSPECCGGWNNSKRVANLILKPFEISIT